MNEQNAHNVDAHNVETIKESLFITPFYVTQKIASRRERVSTCRKPWKPNFRLYDFLASVRFREIEQRADGNDAGRINLLVRHVIMTLDVIEVDSVGDAGVLI